MKKSIEVKQWKILLCSTQEKQGRKTRKKSKGVSKTRKKSEYWSKIMNNFTTLNSRSNMKGRQKRRNA